MGYGEFIGKNKTLLVTSDRSVLGKLAKTALIAGLVSSGVDVLDGGVVMECYTLRDSVFKTDGALHCECLANAGSNEVNIRCWMNGVLLKGTAKENRNHFTERRLSLLPSKDFGQHRYVSGLEEEYVKKLAEIYREHVKTVPVAVLDTGSGDLTFLVKEFLRELNCEIVDPAAKSKKRPFLFIKLGKNGWELLDENQRTLNDDQLWGLRMLAARLRNKDRIAIPLNISQMMERIAENTKQHIQRTKRESSMWMEVAAELGNNYHDPKGEIDFSRILNPW